MRWGLLGLATLCTLCISSPVAAQKIELDGNGFVTGTWTDYVCYYGVNSCGELDETAYGSEANLSTQLDVAALWNGPVAVTGGIALHDLDATVNYFVRYTGPDANGYATFEAYDITGQTGEYGGCFTDTSGLYGCEHAVINITGGQFPLVAYQPILAPVPEAASWAMMLLGFAGVGLAMRRRAPVAEAIA